MRKLVAAIRAFLVLPLLVGAPVVLAADPYAAALREMIAALAIHPYLSERRFFPELAPNVTHV